MRGTRRSFTSAAGVTACALLALALLALALTLISAGCGGAGEEDSRSSPPSAPEPGAGNTTGLPLSLPDGFSISHFAEGLTRPRVLLLDGNGVLLVSDTAAGRVVALPDRDGDGAADEERTVVEGLDTPHGIAFPPSDPSKLYVAETSRVSVYDYDAASLSASGGRAILDLPGGGSHVTRTIMFLPGSPDTLLVSVGSSANVTHADRGTRAAIFASGPDGAGYREYATGLRNAVFMTVRPGTDEVWVTEMGRDGLGDNLPPDEINIVTEGGDYGWPNCYGKNVHDTRFDTAAYPPGRDPCAGMIPSHIDLQAHSAPLGLAFVESTAWPPGYRGDLLVCFHGSWDRSEPTGDKVVLVRLDGAGAYEGVEDFITGWQRPDGSRLGRPAGVLFDAAGTAYIADDMAGTVYRVAPPSR